MRLVRGVLVTVCAGVALFALAVPAPAAPVAAPSNFVISVNGHRLTARDLAVTGDAYITTRTGPLTIAVRWNTDLRGTNHRVIVMSASGDERRRCLSGTSCVYTTRWSLKPTQETSWSVLIYRGTKLVSEKALCLAGKG